ncbi:dihydrolipoamide succinyltransferase [Amycolatopsis sp. A1MSW2902]|uniref:2-oxo acid dehydrogenase subunit E2 n=1 Tax=Amycolatopsis sp. A1MSW2902 TaxID=687413 RepID=UPI00307CEBF1
MAYSVILPELGESVTESTVTRWLKQVGDVVEVDEPLLEISTDKVDTEVPSPAAGTLQRIVVQEDETVEVGAQLAVLDDGTDSARDAEATEPEPASVAQKVPEPSAPPPAASSSVPPAADSEDDQKPRIATPLIRRLAAEHDIDLSKLTGSGAGGRIRKQDVLAAIDGQYQGKAVAAPSAPAARPAASAPAAQTPSTPAPAGRTPVRATPGTVQKAGRIRQVIAKRTRESLQASAQLTQVFEVDVAYLNEETSEITYFGQEHLSVAVDTEDGLMSPVIHNAGELNLAGLARATADLAVRARTGKLKPGELSGGTFSVTNLGSNGALFDTPIINQPQSGILGVGAVVRRPVVVIGEDGQEAVAIRSMVYLALIYDHRLVDGADAGRFLTTIKARLEEGRFESEVGL